jgi:putative heme-binding domain-containing protein
VSLKRLSEASEPRAVRLRAVWTLFACGLLDEQAVLALFHDPDPYVRGWAVQFIGDARQSLSSSALTHLESLAQRESDKVTRRYLASVLQRLPTEQRWGMLERLIAHPMDQYDQNLPSLVWFGMEPVVEESPLRALALARTSGSKPLCAFTVRRAAASPSGRDVLVTELGRGDGTTPDPFVLEELLRTVTSQGGATMPESWPQAFRALRSIDSKSVQDMAHSLAIMFGDQSAFPYFRGIVIDKTVPTDQRRSALANLVNGGDVWLATELVQFLHEPELQGDIVRAMGRFESPETTQILIENLARFDPRTRSDAMLALVSRRSSAESLVEAIEHGTIPTSTVPAYVARQVATLGSTDLTARMEKAWGKIGQTSSELHSEYDRYRRLLSRKRLAKANVHNGFVLYTNTCGKCHNLFGQGGTIGPGLTGANRTSLEYWLENVLEPNAIIGRDYQMSTFVTTDGLVLNGLVVEENDNAVTIQTVNEKVVLPVHRIDARRQSESSIMPAGQLQTMSEQEVIDLFAYLMSSRGAESAPHEKK